MKVPPTGPFQFDPGGVFDDETLEVTAAPEYSNEPDPAPVASTKTQATKLSVGDILERARERLAELKTELEAMSKLQIEHDKLERLLAAADALDT